MKFYDCKPAPSPRRARVFIAEKGIEIPTVQVDLNQSVVVDAKDRCAIDGFVSGRRL